ncbi:MAG TPA: hypothetical protein VEL31_12160 [Ktedonobacteraceae bacterium]|nr:hypothetical protein [Ktedonobacteraceae bacterium]
MPILVDLIATYINQLQANVCRSVAEAQGLLVGKTGEKRPSHLFSNASLPPYE